MGCRVEGRLPGHLLLHAWAWACQLPASDTSKTNTVRMAEGLAKLECTSAFDRRLPAAVQLRVACANFPGTSKGRALHTAQGRLRKEALTLSCHRTR